MSFLEYLPYGWHHVLELAIGHAVVVAISLAIAVVIGVSLGVLAYRRERTANVALAITLTFRPSLRLRCSGFSSRSSASATSRRS